MSLLYPNGFLFGQQQQQQQQQQQMLQQQQAQAQAQAQAAHNQAQAQLHQQQQQQQQKQHQVQQQQSSTARASLGGAQLAPSFGIAKPSIIGPAPAMRLSQNVTVGQHLTQDAASAQPQTPQQTQTRQHQVYSVQQGGALSASNGDVPIGVPQVRQSINYIQAGTPTANGSPSMLQNTWNQGISTTALKVNAVKDKDSVIIGLEKKVAEMEHMMRQKNAQIEALQKEVAALSMNSNIAKKGAAVQPRVTSGRASNGDYGRPLSMYKNGPITEQRPEHPYKCTDPNDPIDVRLEEFYNTTNSAIPFRRINKGWYRFGETSVSLDIVNGKLMAKTDEGWNRGKLGDVEKFVIQFEPLERKKANIPYTQQF